VRSAISAEEALVLARIGEVINSSPQIGLVYDLFAHEDAQLIKFDQIGITRRSVDGELTPEYVEGMTVPGWRLGLQSVYAGSIEERIETTRQPQRWRANRLDELVEQFPAEVPAFEAGMRSQLGVPIIYADDVIGFLTVSSSATDSFPDDHARLLGLIAGQIAGTLANTRLLAASKESEERYRGLVDFSPDAIVIHQERIILYANRAASNLLGLSDPDELIGVDIGDFVEPDYWSLFVDRLASLYGESERTGVDTIGLVKADGTTIYVEAVSAPAQFGEMTVGQTILNDVTNRRESETLLWWLGRENEVLASLGRIVASSPHIEDVIEDFSVELKELLSFDRLVLAALDETGRTFTATHVVGMAIPGLDEGSAHPVSDHVWKESMDSGLGELVSGNDMALRGETSAVHRLLIDAGITSFVSVPLRHEDKLRGFLSVGSVLRDAYEEKELGIAQRVAQQISGAVEISRLNRQSAEATAALRDSESKLFDLFENAPMAYHEADADGTILRVNQTALNMFGYAEDEMVGRSILDFLVESEEVATNIERFKHEVPATSSMWERTFIAKDGTFVPILVTVKVQTDAQGKTIGQLATMQDMSELKRLEEQLLRAQKMDALGKLAGGIAHDFNNLLTGMMLQAGIARNAVSVDGPQAESGLDEIVKIAKRASLLTRQLLTFSRSQMLNPIICQPNEMVTDMHLMLRRLIGEHIELVLLLDSNVGSISIDPSQFEQVLVNLVLNARDAVADGGKITIKTATTVELPVETGDSEFGVEADNGYLVLTVADDGKGMTNVVKNRAFEPFFTTKEVGQGTGLGLATCYGIIAQSGGAMDLISEAGVGTIFNIYLPIRIASQVRATQEPETPMIATGTETVLLVEDEPSVRRALASVLSDSGYRVLEASNGHEALNVYHDPEASPTDIVVTDVVMPLMGGRELSEKLRAVDPSLKILFTSGYNEDQANLLGGPGEITSFIHKPFLPNDLIADVRALLDRGGDGD